MARSRAVSSPIGSVLRLRAFSGSPGTHPPDGIMTSCHAARMTIRLFHSAVSSPGPVRDPQVVPGRVKDPEVLQAPGAVLEVPCERPSRRDNPVALGDGVINLQRQLYPGRR